MVYNYDLKNGEVCTDNIPCPKPSCCRPLSLTKGGPPVVSNSRICWPQGTEEGFAYVPPKGTSILGWTSGSVYYTWDVPCPYLGSSAISLAVYATAATTALYVLY